MQTLNLNIKVTILKCKADQKGKGCEYYGDLTFTTNIERVLITEGLVDSCIEAITQSQFYTLVAKIGRNSQIDLRNEVFDNYLNLDHA